eukprot:evm.model.scf_690.1 EVM.evm.TU.scf_690.1   scf_690:1172-7451(+)
MMDSNNFLGNVGVGEREGRVASDIVFRRYFRLAHGIGRSGDIAAEQPKAAGSSLVSKLATLLVADALAIAGLQDIGAVSLLPLATGMALTMTFLALKAQRPEEAVYVVWPCIDQKTCLKAIVSANLKPVVIEALLDGDELQTDVDAIEAKVAELGADRVACVCTTTSCFAPRGCDRVVEVAKCCTRLGVPHLINNAYGVQSAQLCRVVTSALRKGRVDAIVQSTDKNFMVPVGGSVVAAPKSNCGLVQSVNKSYPGRASVSAHLDVLITLLHWGASGWRKVLAEREDAFDYMKAELQGVARDVGERVLETPNNPISIALTIDTLSRPAAIDSEEGGEAPGPSSGGHSQGACSDQQRSKDVTFFGSMLWSRCISGTRVVARGKKQTVAGMDFVGYGAHHSHYPHDYMTAAAALGTTRADVDKFACRLRDTLDKRRKSLNAKPPAD